MRRVDVVVVGAGLAGLSAARSLAGEADVLVLEARDRVGGRTVGHTFPNGSSVEMGGQWVGGAHTELLRLTGELGLEPSPPTTRAPASPCSTASGGNGSTRRSGCPPQRPMR